MLAEPESAKMVPQDVLPAQLGSRQRPPAALVQQAEEKSGASMGLDDDSAGGTFVGFFHRLSKQGCVYRHALAYARDGEEKPRMFPCIGLRFRFFDGDVLVAHIKERFQHFV